LYKWSCRNGFTFSPSETCCIHFCRKHQLHADPILYLGNIPIPFVESSNCLVFTLIGHLHGRTITQLRVKSTKAWNILCILSGSSWGADRVCLLRLYCALVRSVLDYGSIVYASVAPSSLRPLNTIHCGGIRLSTGVYETSHIESLLVEAGEPSLQKRRSILLGSYAAKVLGILHHPARRTILQPSFMTLYEIRHSLPRPAGIRFLCVLKNQNIGVPKAV
jgi:hypothetical protein